MKTMPLLPIVVYPDDFLKKKAEPVTDFGPEVQTLVDSMIETMYVKDGVGLAAPQIGVSKRILIVSPNMTKGEEHVLVNPMIYESHGRELGPEGCLSFPGVTAEIWRAPSIELRYQDRFGKEHDVGAKHFFARVIQHEMDHLDGILLIDHLDFDQRQKLLSEYQS